MGSARTSLAVRRRVLGESRSPIIPRGAVVQTPSFRISILSAPSSDSSIRSVFPSVVRKNSVIVNTLYLFRPSAVVASVPVDGSDDVTDGDSRRNPWPTKTRVVRRAPRRHQASR